MKQRKLFKGRYPAFKVGPLPAFMINKALDLDLEPAEVWVSKACHRHIAEGHPRDYPLIKSNIIDIITRPTYAGQDPKHGSNFYLVRRVASQDEIENILVAIGLELNTHGAYNIKSAYRIDAENVDARRLKGYLKSLIYT